MGLFEDEFGLKPWYYFKDVDNPTFIKKRKSGGGTEPDNPYFYDFEEELEDLVYVTVKPKTDEYIEDTHGRVMKCPTE